MFNFLIFLLIACWVTFIISIIASSIWSAIIWTIIVAVVIALLWIKIVTPYNVKLVEFLGKYNRLLKPWLSFIIPLLERTKDQTLKKLNFEVNVEWVTADNVSCYIWLNVVYYVDDNEQSIFDSVYTIESPGILIKASIDEQLRAMVVEFDHKQIFSKREEIWEAVEQRLRKKLSQFGFILDSLQVKDITLEKGVMAAMNNVTASLREKQAAENEAEAQKIRQVKDAEAEKESKRLIWEGMAEQRKAIAKWFKEAVQEIKATDKSINWRLVLDFLLDSSRIETLGSIGNKNSKLIYLNENLEWYEMSKKNKKTEKILSWIYEEISENDENNDNIKNKNTNNNTNWFEKKSIN